MYCTNCGKQIEDNSVCDCQKQTPPPPPPPQPPPGYASQTGQPTHVYVNQPYIKGSNGMAVAGFVLALIAVFFSWIPVLGWIIWLLGLIFSIIGIATAKRKQSGLGLAITGLVLSLLGLIILIALLVFAAGIIATIPFWTLF